MERELEQYAMQAFQLLRRPDDTAAETATSVAYAVGNQARRMGISQEQLGKWLQSAYGKFWVRSGNLNPGLDMKEVKAAIMKAYSK
jgi:hypothetical protein